MSDSSHDPAVECHSDQDLPTSPALPDARRLIDWPRTKRDLAGVLTRAVMHATWRARHPRESLALPPAQAPDRIYYQTEDGWEAPLWRYPPAPDAPGEPVLLVHGLVNDHSVSSCPAT